MSCRVLCDGVTEIDDIEPFRDKEETIRSMWDILSQIILVITRLSCSSSFPC